MPSDSSPCHWVLKKLSYESVSRVRVGTSPTTLSSLVLGAVISWLPLFSCLNVATEKRVKLLLVNSCHTLLNLSPSFFTYTLKNSGFEPLWGQRGLCLKFWGWNCCIPMPLQCKESYWYSLYRILQNLHNFLVLFFPDSMSGGLVRSTLSVEMLRMCM